MALATSKRPPPGYHDYQSLILACRRGRYRFAKIRTRSGRLVPLISILPKELLVLKQEARKNRIGIILLGSRVSGPRNYQRTLHPILAKSLPLYTTRRDASATYPAVEGVRIDKTAIKELGFAHPNTSDLTVVLIATHQQSLAFMNRLASRLEQRFKKLIPTFPTRFFSLFNGVCFSCEADFQQDLRDYLKNLLPKKFSAASRSLDRAGKELYAVINLPLKR